MKSQLSNQIQSFFETNYPRLPALSDEARFQQASIFSEWSLKKQGHVWFQHVLSESMNPLGDQRLLHKACNVIYDMDNRLVHSQAAALRLVRNDAVNAFQNNLEQHFSTPSKWLLQLVEERDTEGLFTLIDRLDELNVLAWIDVKETSEWTKKRDKILVTEDRNWLASAVSKYLQENPETVDIFNPSSPEHNYSMAPLRLAASTFVFQAFICMRTMQKLNWRDVAPNQLNWQEFKACAKELTLPEQVLESVIKNCLLINSTGTIKSFANRVYKDLPKKPALSKVEHIMNSIYMSGSLESYFEKALQVASETPVAFSANVYRGSRVDSLIVEGSKLIKHIKPLTEINVNTIDIAENEVIHSDLKDLMLGHFVNGGGGTYRLYQQPSSFRSLFKFLASEQPSAGIWQDTIRVNSGQDHHVWNQPTKAAMTMAPFGFMWYPIERWATDPQWHSKVTVDGVTTTRLRTVLDHYADKLNTAAVFMMQVQKHKGDTVRRGDSVLIEPYSRVLFDTLMPTLAELALIQTKHDPSWLTGSSQALENGIKARFGAYLPPKQSPAEKKAWIDLLDLAYHHHPEYARDIWLSLFSQPTVPANHVALLRWGKTLGLSEHEITEVVHQARESIADKDLTVSHDDFNAKMVIRIEKLMGHRDKVHTKGQPAVKNSPTHDMPYDTL